MFFHSTQDFTFILREIRDSDHLLSEHVSGGHSQLEIHFLQKRKGLMETVSFHQHVLPNRLAEPQGAFLFAPFRLFRLSAYFSHDTFEQEMGQHPLPHALANVERSMLDCLPVLREVSQLLFGSRLF